MATARTPVAVAQTRRRPLKYPRREIVNAIRYVLRTGCSWRMLPHDLPPWRIVFHYFRTWREDGTWQHANDVLHSNLRHAQGRQATPSAAIIDSQHNRQPVGKDC